jgi:hypothetical protein
MYILKVHIFHGVPKLIREPILRNFNIQFQRPRCSRLEHFRGAAFFIVKEIFLFSKRTRLTVALYVTHDLRIGSWLGETKKTLKRPFFFLIGNFNFSKHESLLRERYCGSMIEMIIFMFQRLGLNIYQQEPTL